MAKTLGILGGLGPSASVYFYQLITEHTYALRDQDHLNIMLVSKAEIPDRSEFIMGKSEVSPFPMMQEAACKLGELGADIIAIPCNTAHYFYDELEKISPVPVLNIVRETVALAKKAGAKKIGVLATTGTVLSGAYRHAAEKIGMEAVFPTDKSQAALMHIIYGEIKTAKAPTSHAFYSICDELMAKGCDALILGCTELSLIPKDETYHQYPFIDSLYVLAAKSILACGKKICGFEAPYTQITP